MQVIVSEFGTFLGKKSERLVIKKGKKTIQEVPFFQIEQVLVTTGGATLSTDAIRECVRSGIRICFLSGSGRPYAQLTSPEVTGTVKTRREQILAYEDERGVVLAKAFADGKLKNQVNLVKYFAKYRKSTDRELYGRIYDGVSRIEALRRELEGVKGTRIDSVREKILNLEGRGAAVYWDLVKAIFPEDVTFNGREHRGATDPINSTLNYGYGVLYTQVWGAVVFAGLEPFAGFLHVDRPGKPSLVLDFIEEFRQQVVDRTILAMINKGFRPEVEEGRLSEMTRKELASRVLERLESEERYGGKRHKIRTIMQQQARHVATFLRREGPYKPFVGSW